MNERRSNGAGESDAKARRACRDPHRKLRATGMRIGGMELMRYGEHKWYWRDTYHWILRLTWPRFLLLISAVYLGMNLLFACLYAVVPGSVANARPGSFVDLYFFSIETLATVGYGYMNPGNLWGHCVASVEILLGMMGIAVITGLMYARFSQPSARISFSRCAVITLFNGVPTLMLRTANERNNTILDASVRAAIVRTETTLEGQTFNRFYDLKLERERTSVFALSWTIMHRIDASSPLYGIGPDVWLRDEIGLSVSISGQDDTFHDTVHARVSFGPADVHFGERFVDIISEDVAQNQLIMDYTRFHDTVPDGLPALDWR